MTLDELIKLREQAYDLVDAKEDKKASELFSKMADSCGHPVQRAQFLVDALSCANRALDFRTADELLEEARKLLPKIPVSNILRLTIEMQEAARLGFQSH